MLKYKDNILTINSTITSHDTVLKLVSDIDCVIAGLIEFSNKSYKTLNFIKENDYYKARLIITQEDLPYLDGATFAVAAIDSNTSKASNKVPIKFDVAKIAKTIKVASSNDIKDMQIKLSQLETTIHKISNNNFTFKYTNVPIEGFDYIKPGMIPVSIDNKGNCMFQYPFANIITEINGQKTVNSAIMLVAKDIPIEQTNVEAAIKAHTEAIKELNNLMKTISSELKSTKNKLASVEQALLQHTDSSIV
jgi:hypothetical protein